MSATVDAAREALLRRHPAVLRQMRVVAFEDAIRAEYEDADRWGRAVHDTFCHLRRPMHSDSRHSADELVAAFARLVDR